MPSANTIVLVRHGESEWNRDNRFCGWYDAELSEVGRAEAVLAGKALKVAGYTFDIAFTSLLPRANTTLTTVLQQVGQPQLPVARSWRLNEKHYGDLTGYNKAETAEKYGKEQVKLWRRSFDIPPPPMTADHPYFKSIWEDKRYAIDGPGEAEFPTGESLKLTIDRMMPFWQEKIAPAARAGKKILIVAHGTTLRCIVKQLSQECKKHSFLFIDKGKQHRIKKAILLEGKHALKYRPVFKRIYIFHYLYFF